MVVHHALVLAYGVALGAKANNMGTDFTRLGAIKFRDHGPGTPVPMPDALRTNVWLTLVVEFSLLGLFAVVPHEFWQVSIQRDGFFTLQPLVDLGNFVLALGYSVVPYLMGLNLVSLLLALLTLTISFGMRRRVQPIVPLLATINLIPTGMSIVLAVVVATVLVVVVVIHAVLWSIGVSLNICILIGVIAAFLRLAARR